MTLHRTLGRLFALLLLPFMAACGAPPDAGGGRAAEVARLETAILALGPNVDPSEAARAARLAYSYTDQLAREYEIEDSALVHNTKVNMGLKPRGLCYHWARDIHSRMAQERFATLSFTRAVANADNPILLEHTTAVIMARGDGYRDGLVLDPWRYGGVLFFARVPEDTRYDWKPREAFPARPRGDGSLRASKTVTQ